VLAILSPSDTARVYRVGRIAPALQRLAAINQQRCAGDVASIIGGEEGHGGGDILGLPDSP